MMVREYPEPSYTGLSYELIAADQPEVGMDTCLCEFQQSERPAYSGLCARRQPDEHCIHQLLPKRNRRTLPVRSIRLPKW